MEASSNVKVEHIGGMPIILEQLKELGLAKKIDKYVESHGNWAGASKGVATCVWLSYIISNCDHRLSHVSDWVSSNELSLSKMLGDKIRPEDVADDKLGQLLDDFSDTDCWNLLEADVNRSFIRVYGLNAKVIQLDPTIGKSFKKVVAGGLFQYGNSKHFRVDLPQFKTILVNLEEGSIPLTSITVSGETADDVLYLPAIKQAKASLAQSGLLWVGDSKLGSLKNRVFIEKEGDYYLCPLSKVQLSNDKLLSKYLQKVLDNEVALEEIIYKGKVVAQGYVTSEEKEYDGNKWVERQFVVKSEQYAKSQEGGLNRRLKKAIEEIAKLNKKASGKRVYKTTEELEAAIQKIIQHRKVKNLLKIEQKISYEEKEIRAYKGRASRIEKKMTYSVQAQIDTLALTERVNLLGWRVYVSNQGEDLMDIQRAVGLYREEYKIERRIRNLKEEVTKLLPIFLKKDNRIRGLINLLMLALKIISGIEYKVHKNLAKKEEKLGGIYAGNPKITTATPTINKMMEAFKYYAIVFVINGNQTIQTICPELNPTQLKIIELMEINKHVFELKSSINQI